MVSIKRQRGGWHVHTCVQNGSVQATAGVHSSDVWIQAVVAGHVAGEGGSAAAL